MNRLLNFFKEKNKVVAHSHVEESDISPNYFLSSCKAVGMTIALLTASSLSIGVANAASVDNSIPFGVTVDRLLNEYNSMGLFPNNSIPNVKIVDRNESSSSAHIAGIKNSCDIKISLDSNGKAESLIPDVEISFNNNSIYREASLNHEIGHCYSNKVFKNSGLSKTSERWMNEWVIGDYVGSNPIKNLYEENFADTYGLMLTLHNHNFSKESISLLKKWKETRKIKRESGEKNGDSLLSNSHQTDFALDYLYKNLEKVKKMDIKNYASFAMEASSRSVIYILNSNREMVKKISFNNEGDWVQGSSNNRVGEQGLDLINQVIGSYRDNVFNYAKVLTYKQTIEPNTLETSYKNDIPETTRRVINSTNLLDKVKINSTRVNNHEVSWNIEGGEAGKTAVFVMLNGKKLDFEMSKLKDKYNYNAFQENIEKVLKSPYELNEVKADNKAEKIQTLKKVLANSPFQDDRMKAKTLKLK